MNIDQATAYQHDAENKMKRAGAIVKRMKTLSAFAEWSDKQEDEYHRIEAEYNQLIGEIGTSMTFASSKM